MKMIIQTDEQHLDMLEVLRCTGHDVEALDIVSVTVADLSMFSDALDALQPDAEDDQARCGELSETFLAAALREGTK